MSQEDRPVTCTNLGYVLLRIYDFPFWGAIYLPKVERYETNTPCIVVTPDPTAEVEEEALHQDCLNKGFANWLNVAVVSDVCDDTETHTEDGLVAAFNKQCKEDGFLSKQMNYRRQPPPPNDD
jgi:hypothetical protein